MASDSKVAIITGAGSGIGKETALAFLDNGYSVALAGRRRDMLDLTQPELDVCKSAFLGAEPRLAYHLGRHVDTDHSAVPAHLCRGEKAIDSRPAAEVEDRFALLERGYCHWITAAQAEIASLGKICQFVGRVSQDGGLIVGYGPGLRAA